MAAEAERNLGRARQVVEEMYTQVAEKLGDQKGMDDYQREILERALHFYESFALSRSQQPEVRFEAARAGLRVGDILQKLGRTADAEQAYRNARDILVPLLAKINDDVAGRRVLSEVYNGLGLVLADTGRSPEARAAHRHARELLQESAARDRNSASLLARTDMFLAALDVHDNRLTEAESAYRDATKRLEALVRDDPEDFICRANLGTAFNNLGALMHRLRHPASALGYWQRSREILEGLVRDSPGDVRHRVTLGSADHNLGVVQSETGKTDQALASYRRAVVCRELLTREHPDVILYQNQLAGTYSNLGNLLNQIGRTADAFDSFSAAIRIREQLVRSHPELDEYANDLARSRDNFAMLLVKLGRLAEAMESYRQAADVREALIRRNPTVGTYRNGLATSLLGVCAMLRQLGRPAEAQRPLRRAIELWRDNPSADAIGFYNQACAHGIFSSLLSAGELIERKVHDDLAIAALRRAIATGFHDLNLLRQDTDLDPLRLARISGYWSWTWRSPPRHSLVEDSRFTQTDKPIALGKVDRGATAVRARTSDHAIE